MKHIEVVAAIIVRDGRCFATRRGYGEYKGWWEFPGGKIEPGETHQEALIREIKEELEADIEVLEFLKTVEHEYPEFYLTMHCYICKLLSDEPVLKEHDAARWLDSESLNIVDWLPADLEIIDEIRTRIIE